MNQNEFYDMLNLNSEELLPMSYLQEARSWQQINSSFFGESSSDGDYHQSQKQPLTNQSDLKARHTFKKGLKKYQDATEVQNSQQQTNKKILKRQRTGPRRKGSEKQKLKRIIAKTNLLYKRENNTKSGEKKQKRKPTIGMAYNNILANAKIPIIRYFQKTLGKRNLQRNVLLKYIYQKKGLALSDYQNMCKNENLWQKLKEFCRKKIIYRELMISRSTVKGKILNLYFYDVLEQNIINRSFDSLSQKKIQIERQKKKLTESNIKLQQRG